MSSVQCKLNETICAAVAPSEKYCLVGSGAGHIVIIILNENVLKVVNHLKPAEFDDTTHPIESIDFWKEGNGEMFAAASLSGLVYVYEPDKSREKCRLKLLHPDGVNGVKFCPGEKPRVSRILLIPNPVLKSNCKKKNSKFSSNDKFDRKKMKFRK